MRILLLLLLASPLFADCRPGSVIGSLRPGEAFYMPDSNDATVVKWANSSVLPVSKSEYTAALSACQASEATKVTQKQQAILDAKNVSKTPGERMDALLLLLGY